MVDKGRHRGPNQEAVVLAMQLAHQLDFASLEIRIYPATRD
jgi:hypothetical protein